MNWNKLFGIGTTTNSTTSVNKVGNPNMGISSMSTYGQLTIPSTPYPYTVMTGPSSTTPSKVMERFNKDKLIELTASGFKIFTDDKYIAVFKEQVDDLGNKYFINDSFEDIDGAYSSNKSSLLSFLVKEVKRLEMDLKINKVLNDE